MEVPYNYSNGKELSMTSPPHKDWVVATLLQKGWPTHTQTTTTTTTTTIPSDGVLATILGKGFFTIHSLEKVFYIIFK
jgi:hypothetical protein